MSIRTLAPTSSQLCPGARRTAGMEVSIVALICIRSTFLPLFSFVIRPHSKDSKCAEFVIGSSIFQQSGAERGAEIMFGDFPGCFGGAVATLTDREGRRSPTVLSADALCMRSSSAAALLPLRVLRTEARVTATRASAQLKSPGSTSGCMCDLTDRPVFIAPGECTWSRGGARVPLSGAPSKDKLTTHLMA